VSGLKDLYSQEAFDLYNSERSQGKLMLDPQREIRLPPGSPDW
jgi:hypothetical protein